LPAPPHEPPTRGGRLLIVVTASVGLALVGVMALRMTPGQSQQRDALVTVSTASATSALGSVGGQATLLAGVASEAGGRFTDLLGRTLSSLLPVTTTPSSDLSSASPRRSAAFAVVTPFGADNLGVTTAAAVEGADGIIEAMLPSGDIVNAELVETHDGVAIVELPEQAGGTDAASLAAARAGRGGLTVVAYGAAHSLGEEAGLQTLSVPEAAPIFDVDGNLVGLCTIGPDGVEMLTVRSLPGVESPLSASTDPGAGTSEPLDGTSIPVSSDTAVPPGSPPPATLPGSTPASTDGSLPDSSEVATSEPPESSTPETTALQL
jgi:hypothetical protein